MAKHQESRSASLGKMTVVVFQLEGNDATLQQGILSIKEALSKALPQGTRQVISRVPQVLSESDSSKSHYITEDPDQDELVAFIKY